MKLDVGRFAHRLVAIPSESILSNVPVIDAIQDTLEPHGFRFARYTQEVTHSGSGEKVNLVAERGEGPVRVVFSGHVDTVPVGDESLWSHNPFGGDGIIDGVLWGRGSLDMKGQVAAMCAASAEADDVLDKLTVVLAITADEETGHFGVKTLTEKHVFENVAGAVVGEPTNLDVYGAHKGGMTLYAGINGISCHSSRPREGVNAISNAVRLLSRLEDALMDWEGYRHPAFGEEPQTYAVAQIHAGVANNVVPARCDININARVTAPDQFDAFSAIVDGIAAELAAEDERAGIAPERRFSAELRSAVWAPPMITDTDSAWYRLLAGVANQSDSQFAAYGTDGGVLSQVGLPCVVWGPGDIGMAHVPNERIAVAELERGASEYVRFLRAAAGADLPVVTTTRWEW